MQVSHETGDSPSELDIKREYVIGLIDSASPQVLQAFEQGDHDVLSKGLRDFSTETDLSVDHFLAEGIRRRYPDTDILTEETAPENADYSSYRDKEAVWIIDPIDGTTNFNRGDPNFGISVGLVSYGKPILGVVHLPVTQETFWAQADKPEAFRNLEPVHVSSVSSLGETVVAGDFGHDEETHAVQLEWMRDLSKQVRQIKMMGCAVSVIARLAEGKLDAYIHSDLRPWDVAAAVLIAEKAGARVSQANGDQWDVFTSELLLTNNHLHEPLMRTINHTE